MLRKFAGSSFAVALIALMVMKHVVFGFCLCQEQFILDRDACCAEMASEAVCCCEECDAPPVAPCNDCIIDLQLEVADFLWSVDDFSPADQFTFLLPPPFTEQSTAFLPPVAHAFDHPVRGSPPGSPPLYLRQSVLRL